MASGLTGKRKQSRQNLQQPDEGLALLDWQPCLPAECVAAWLRLWRDCRRHRRHSSHRWAGQSVRRRAAPPRCRRTRCWAPSAAASSSSPGRRLRILSAACLSAAAPARRGRLGRTPGGAPRLATRRSSPLRPCRKVRCASSSHEATIKLDAEMAPRLERLIARYLRTQPSIFVIFGSAAPWANHQAEMLLSDQSAMGRPALQPCRRGERDEQGPFSIAGRRRWWLVVSTAYRCGAAAQ